MSGRRFAAILALVGACFGATPAHGQQAAEQGGTSSEVSGTTQGADATSRQRAKELYEEGLSAYRNGRYSDAIDKLLEADQAMPNAAFSYNIALVYEKMGDQRSALRWLRSHLRQSGKGVTDDATVAKVRKLEAELQTRGLQQVSILSSPPGATIQMDGHALGITPFTTEVTPGTHRIGLTLQGYESVQKNFDLRPDRSLDVEVVLAATKTEDAAQAHPAPAPPAPFTAAPAADASKVQPSAPLAELPSLPPVQEPPSPRVRPWTWIGLGVGAGLLGGSAYFELDRRKYENRAESASQVDFESRYDDMESRKTTARVFVAAGSVVLAAGLTLLTIDLTRAGAARTAVLGGCAAQGVCAAMRGQF